MNWEEVSFDILISSLAKVGLEHKSMVNTRERKYYTWQLEVNINYGRKCHFRFDGCPIVQLRLSHGLFHLVCKTFTLHIKVPIAAN